MKARATIMIILAMALFSCTRSTTLAMFDVEDKSGTFSPRQLEQIGDHIAAALGQADKVRIVPRKSLRGACPEADLVCQVAKAKELKASGFVEGRILKPGELCSLVLSLYSKDGGKVLRSSSINLECDPDAVLTASDRVVRQLGPPWTPKSTGDQVHVHRYEEEMRHQMKKVMEQRKELERLAMELREREEALARREAELSEPAEPPAPVLLPAAGGKGKLSINSHPWAKVSIDGRPVGNTPLANLELDAGEVEILLEGPDGRKVTRKVVIEPGKTIKMVVRLPDK